MLTADRHWPTRIVRLPRLLRFRGRCLPPSRWPAQGSPAAHSLRTLAHSRVGFFPLHGRIGMAGPQREESHRPNPTQNPRPSGHSVHVEHPSSQSCCRTSTDRTSSSYGGRLPHAPLGRETRWVSGGMGHHNRRSPLPLPDTSDSVFVHRCGHGLIANRGPCKGSFIHKNWRVDTSCIDVAQMLADGRERSSGAVLSACMAPATTTRESRDPSRGQHRSIPTRSQGWSVQGGEHFVAP